MSPIVRRSGGLVMHSKILLARQAWDSMAHLLRLGVEDCGSRDLVVGQFDLPTLAAIAVPVYGDMMCHGEQDE